ncbi:MAG TPA: MBOAT family protein [Verrucomicrobiae bacterium]|nr:MBOAT family protein [Verrucomicrobiae bacterium]
MLFNSSVFAVFFLLVYTLYLLLRKNLKAQNFLLAVSSAVFYGWWDWRFLALMYFTVTVDYVMARAIAGSPEEGKRKLFLAASVGLNLLVLGVFKYFNFFLGSLSKAAHAFGASLNFPFFQIVLPVGISFYTFQSISYVVDVYRKDIEASKSFLDFAAFVTFFPQLVAGPIERASHLLPQMQRPRALRLESFYEGSYLIFIGLFKKVYVADNLAHLVDRTFSGPPYGSATVILSLYAFAFQIYCDFSGYSDIARGLGKCMGFDIMQNFNLPYFSWNPREFWSRWHISLSTWLRDYLYIPLGGNRKGTFRTCRNLALTMLLGGLWHGARGTFVIWGAYHAFLLIAHRLASGRMPKLPDAVKALVFFHLVCLGWLFFRANSIGQIGQMLAALVSSPPDFFAYGPRLVLAETAAFTALLFAMEAFQNAKKDPLAVFHMPLVPRALLYTFIFYSLATFGVTGGKEFIYFRF